jgi:hypothetical protein
MLKPLLSIGACRRDLENGRLQAVRDTWLPACEGVIDHIFLIGGQRDVPVDALWTGEADGIDSLAQKTHAACVYALEHGHTHLFQCFTDTYVRPERLIASDYWRHEYIGYHGGHENALNYASGGAGYWLSKRCIELVALEIPPMEWAEDRWVGQALAKHGIFCAFDGRYTPRRTQVLKSNDLITTHLSVGTGNYCPQWMHDVHEDFMY